MSMVCRHSAYVFSQDRSQSGTFRYINIYSLSLSLIILKIIFNSDFLFFRAWIQGALAIEVLLGLTWVFGYFFINKETVAVAYIFTILNSLQGLFIFIFHCAMNRKVKKTTKIYFFT